MLQIAYILVYYKIYSCNYYHMGNMEEGNSFPENASYIARKDGNFGACVQLRMDFFSINLHGDDEFR